MPTDEDDESRQPRRRPDRRSGESAYRIDVLVEAPAWTHAFAAPGGRVEAPSPEALAEAAARAALLAADAPDGAGLALALADDAAVRALNARFRERDRPTNVLSFPDGSPDPEAGGVALGDVILAYETVAREAADQGKTLADHLAHLTVHGVLHLLDHDHEDPGEAEIMEALERRVLAGLGIADPYGGEGDGEGGQRIPERVR
jgi:probable rRNA maturation factor